MNSTSIKARQAGTCQAQDKDCENNAMTSIINIITEIASNSNQSIKKETMHRLNVEFLSFMHESINALLKKEEPALHSMDSVTAPSDVLRFLLNYLLIRHACNYELKSTLSDLTIELSNPLVYQYLYGIIEFCNLFCPDDARRIITDGHSYITIPINYACPSILYFSMKGEL